MKRSLVIALISLSIFSCSLFQKSATPTTPRVPQQAATQVNTEAQTVFNNIMNETQDSERSRRMGKYFERQRDFYFIAQGLVNNFDEELAKLDHLKSEGIEITEKDKYRFYKASYQMRIAWEFAERNLNEFLGAYELVLKSANDTNSMYNRASIWIVKNVVKELEAGWKKGDRAATIKLAEHLDDVVESVQTEFLAANKKMTLVPSYEKWSKVNDDVRAEAQAQSVRYAQQRKQTHFDTEIAKEWLDYAKERAETMDEEMQIFTDGNARKPQALDTLYPDPGGPGQVTGNRFPQNTWALSFDDGPHPTHTIGMLSVLEQAGLQGNFFWLAQNMEKYPALVKKAGEQHHNRAVHSFSHQNLPKMSQEKLNHEIYDAFDVYQREVGESATMFRCPYGACGGANSNIRQMIAKRGALHILWNVDSLDWQDPNPQSVFERAKKQVEVLNRGIILFHDIHPQSVQALKLLTDYMKTKPYRIKSLPEIITEVRGSEFKSP